MLVRVIGLHATFICSKKKKVMKSPLSSVTNFTKVNSKLLFINIANPFLLEVEELKYALYPHFEVIRLCISGVLALTTGFSAEAGRPYILYIYI